jgi:hypothetical protein
MVNQSLMAAGCRKGVYRKRAYIDQATFYLALVQKLARLALGHEIEDDAVYHTDKLAAPDDVELLVWCSEDLISQAHSTLPEVGAGSLPKDRLPLS